VRLGTNGGRALAAVLGWVLSASLVLSGCGLLGKPAPLSANAAVKIVLTSPAFTDDVIPARFTCYGARQSPPIFWYGAPPGTKSLVLVVDDSAAPIAPRVYWIVFDIDPSATFLQGGELPPHARVAQNSSGKANYDAPCPAGSPHNYRFTVYALNTALGKSLPPDPPLLQTWTAIAAHVIARGTLTARACPNALPPEAGQCGSGA